jgi:hypothetical protein
VMAENKLHAPGATWRVVNADGRDAAGHLLASLERNDGQDLGDLLVVGGVAARVQRWDWCGPRTQFHDEGGPSIWNPVGRRLDSRAFD